MPRNISGRICASAAIAPEQAPGRWFGKGAEDLGLSGLTHGEELVRLCENIYPLTGERLTLRQRKELSFLAALPCNQRSLVADGQPVIAEVTGTEMQPLATVASSGQVEGRRSAISPP